MRITRRMILMLLSFVTALVLGAAASAPRFSALKKSEAPGGGVPEAPQREGRCGGVPP